MIEKGFTFIELLVVMALIAGLSALGMIRIISFQKDSQIDSFANEIVSTLKIAKNKSETGEIPTNMTMDNFIDGKYPSYGLRTNTDGYEIYVNYETSAGEVNSWVEKYKLPKDTSIVLSGAIKFDRITGNTNENNIILSYKAINERKIYVHSSGYFDVCKYPGCP
jgi:prepilin-type N-terminal cleavage/methylation domain-containing protein